MSRENVEVVRRAYDLFNEGGPEALISAGLWSPEIVFDFSPSGIPGVGVYRGRDEVRAFFEEDWFGAFPFEEWEVVLDELVDHGDQVIGVHRQRGRGASSGVAAELEQAVIYTLRDGQLVRLKFYGDAEQAREAVGMRE